MTSLRRWAYERDKAALGVVWLGAVRCAVWLRYAAGVRFRIFCLSLIVINLQTKIWKYNGCETWSVTLNEESSLRVFERRC